MDVLAEVVRSGLVESRHRGVAVHVQADGTVDWSVGEPDTVIFPRSANKPLQAMGMLAAGLPLDGPELALATSSHSGEEFHLAVIGTILAEAGLDSSALQTPASYPLDGHEHARVLRAGESRSPMLMDCSGKHAAMLLTCVVNGWSIHDYLAEEHPLQQQIVHTFTELTGSAPSVIGIDGCGAPLLATTVRRLGRAVGAVAAGRNDESRRLRAAMREFPEHVSGSRRMERHVMDRIPGAVAKTGAEAVMVVGMSDASAFVVKIEDGAERPLYVAMARALALYGLPDVLPDGLPAVLGGQEVVGEVRPSF